MKKDVLGGLAAACLLIGAGPATGQVTFITGNDLYRDCTADRSEVTYFQQEALCLGFIAGTNDAFVSSPMVLSALTDEDQRDLLCVPTQVEVGQLRDLVVAYLRAHPDKRHLPAATLVFLAVAPSFPCGAG